MSLIYSFDKMNQNLIDYINNRNLINTTEKYEVSTFSRH